MEGADNNHPGNLLVKILDINRVSEHVNAYRCFILFNNFVCTCTFRLKTYFIHLIAQDQNEQTQTQPPSSSTSVPQANTQSGNESQLRSRVNRTQQDNVQGTNRETPQSNREEETSGTGQGELINIRLISSANTMTLQVRADCTLDHLRRCI